jgi:hypothetical protein
MDLTAGKPSLRTLLPPGSQRQSEPGGPERCPSGDIRRCGIAAFACAEERIAAVRQVLKTNLGVASCRKLIPAGTLFERRRRRRSRIGSIRRESHDHLVVFDQAQLRSYYNGENSM